MADIPSERLAEFGIDPRTPWVRVRVDVPTVRGQSIAVQLVGYAPPLYPEPWEQNLKLPTDQESLGAEVFGRDWAGYRFEGIGELRTINNEGIIWQSRRPEPEGKPSRFWIRDAGVSPTTGIPRTRFLAYLHWQRTYQPTPEGHEPGLVAEVRWWPGMSGSWPFYRVHVQLDQSPTARDFAAAERGRHLLSGIERHMSQGGRPRVTQDARIGRLAQAGLKWLKGHQPYAIVEDVGRPEIAEALGDDDPSRVTRSMERPPKIVNADIHRRMHEILESVPVEVFGGFPGDVKSAANSYDDRDGRA